MIELEAKGELGEVEGKTVHWLVERPFECEPGESRRKKVNCLVEVVTQTKTKTKKGGWKGLYSKIEFRSNEKADEVGREMVNRVVERSGIDEKDLKR